MTLEQHLVVLTKMPLFKGIKKEDISLMLNCLKPRVHKFEKNEYIAVAGHDFSSLGILLYGRATVSKENAAGKRLVISIIGAGDIFGEMAVFSHCHKWPATIQAQEKCEVIFFKRNKILGECEQLCLWHRIMIQNFLYIVSERALMLHEKVSYLMLKSIRGKLCTYLLEQYKKAGNKNIMLPLNRNQLADFLNVSRPSLSREMCKLREEGAIDFYLSAVKIINMELLKGGVEGEC